MKNARNFFVILIFSLIPIISYGDIYAQSGYEEDQDGILLLTTKCPGIAGEADLKIAFIRVNGTVMSGCYAKNNRGNFIVKWQNESIAEIPSNIFIIKESKKEKPTSIAPGNYIKLFSGRKQGGPDRHDYVAKTLKESPEFAPYQIFCVTGPDHTKANSYEIDAYNKKHPYLKISTQCKGSGYILVGPFSSEQALRNFTSGINIASYDMHIYKNLVYCKGVCSEIPE